ncbi:MULTISPECIES: hypothetical protein [unclassified Kosmotoga]|jgi:hypothetical protein|uniref:hypothetical protein n=1 Tax=unclassified Kosmotoga TaxID=2631489 RepID=UPI0007C5C565|nr:MULTISPECIES: hypothetical protein [unclassified Kosmotoga]MDI3524049.1 hypothetical protein [Kosmotoga sp.]MDK2953468.1 hypothetical protein [Kosmotoga sp.]OAA19141.1 hypothetical protein DU53_10995 [Kosmotoga sp. DU53]
MAKKSVSLATFLGMFIIIAAIVAFILSLAALKTAEELRIKIDELNKQLNSSYSEFTTRVENEVDSLKSIITGGGLVEKFIIASEFLESFENDLDALFTELQKTPDRPYFRIFVTGKDDVWIGFKKNKNETKYTYQKIFSPGLSQEKFFYFKPPELETKYTITLSKDAYIRVANPNSVYLIFYGFNSGKLVKMPSAEVINLSEEFDLYIPGQ